MAISTVGTILKISKQLELLQTCLEEDPCLFSPTHRRRIREAKNSLRITVGELQRKVSSWDHKVSKTKPGRCWIFHQDNDWKNNFQINTKMANWTQNQASAIAISVPWPKPVGWAEEESTKKWIRSGGSGDIPLFRIVSDSFLCILQPC